MKHKNNRCHILKLVGKKETHKICQKNKKDVLKSYYRLCKLSFTLKVQNCSCKDSRDFKII